MGLVAVHISDGVLPAWPWAIGGFVVVAVLVGLGFYRLSDAEVPLLSLLTAVFFIGSLIHIPLGPTPTSVHLLLNGLVGVLLGPRAGLAIFVGLLMQATLIGHGGFSSLGVNTCVMAIPALAVAAVHRAAFSRFKGCGGFTRFALTFASVFLWGLTAAAGAIWLIRDFQFVDARTWFALVIAGVGVFSAAAAMFERRFESQPEFPIGMFLGTVTALATVGLNALVLALVLPRMESIASVVLLAHLPIAAIEGWVVGTVLSFLHRVAPHLVASGLPAVDRKDLIERDLPLTQPNADQR